MKNQERTPNKITIKADKIDFTAHISKKLIFDNRLTNSEKIILIQMLSLSNFYISLRQTANFLKISKDKLIRIFKGLKAKGYLEVVKNGANYEYRFKQESKYIIEFKPSLIEYYTAEQLNALLNNAETPKKYKNLIKKYFNALILSENELKATIKEIKDFEKPKTEQKTQEEEQNEIDILKYLTSK